MAISGTKVSTFAGSRAALLLGAILSLGLLPQVSLAHDIPVHAAITFNAASSAFTYSTNYTNFLGVVANDISVGAATNIMVLGSRFEDIIDVDTNGVRDVGGKRSMNHFYDPINKRGLTDVGLGRNSFDWASISNCPGTNWNITVSKNLNTSNIWSWQNARNYEWLGLTATNQSARQTNLANMFRAVGQVMHLLEDTTQPQHVRNEQHLDKILGVSVASRSAIEDYGLARSNRLNYAHGMLDWRGAGFAQLKDFWDRDFLRTGGAGALNADLGGGANTLGLAEFSNGNFLGQRAIYGELIAKHSDIHYFAFPSLANTTQPNLKANHLWETAVHGDVTLANFKQGTRLYISKTGAGVVVTNHSVLSYLIAEHPGRSAGLPVVTIADDNVISNYLDILIPKAVGYSAGLLDYYFRGTLAADVPGITNGQDQLTITNASSQNFSGGAFHLFYDDTNGVRTELMDTNFESGYSGNLDSGGTLNAAFTPAAAATNYILLYQGTIGTSSGTNASDPVDAGVAVAATSFDLTNPNFNDLMWDSIDYENSQGTASGFVATNFFAASASVTNGDPLNPDGAGGSMTVNGGDTNQFLYTGPGTVCVLHVVCTNLMTDDVSQALGQIEVDQDGSEVLYFEVYLSQGAGNGVDPSTTGTYDTPFIIAAGTNSNVTVAIEALAAVYDNELPGHNPGNVPGSASVGFYGTLTPAH